MSYIEVSHETKRYQSGETEILANNDVNFTVEKGELVVILGSSGAGKSSLLNILGGMDTASEGSVVIDGNDIAQYNSHQLTDYRRTDVGFVFQFYNLVTNLTANCPARRLADVKADAQSSIDDGQAQVDDAKQQLSDAKQKLDDAADQLADGEKQIADSKATLADAKGQLADGQSQLDSAWDQLEAGRAQLESGRADLDANWPKLVSANNLINQNQRPTTPR